MKKIENTASVVTTTTTVTFNPNTVVTTTTTNAPGHAAPSSTTRSAERFHGRVIMPASRGSQAVEWGLLENWQVNEMEGGKNFPGDSGGPFPDYPDDAQSGKPPEDGLILSGGKTDKRVCVNYTDAELDEAVRKKSPYSRYSGGWHRIPVAPRAFFPVVWEYTAAHITRGYHWFITKDGWDETTRITRAHLEPEPFHKDIYPYHDFYEHESEMVAKVFHSVYLPDGKTGHHVIVLAWIVADTGAAFYQAFDVQFPEHDVAEVEEN